MKDIAGDKTVPNELLNILIKSGNLSMEDIIDEFVTIFITTCIQAFGVQFFTYFRRFKTYL